MPIARHIFGRDKPSLTALAHGDGTPVERRRALGLQQLFRPVLLFGARSDDEPAPAYQGWRLLLVGVPIVAVVLVVILVLFWI